MCFECAQLSRRHFLRSAAAGASAVALPMWPRASFAAAEPDVNAEDALTRLESGNEKYVEAPQLCVIDPAGSRSKSATGQKPWAIVLTCSDSRVVPEIIFGGLDVGELFVVRDAGNIASVEALGSIEYAAEHLGARLIVVLGHNRCGAVSAAVDVVTKNARLPGNIKTMVDSIVPAVRAVKGKPGDMVDNAVRENARLMASKVGSSAIVAELVKHDHAKIVYGRSDLDSGAVEFLG